MLDTKLTQPRSERIQRNYLRPGYVINKKLFRHFNKALVEVYVSVDTEPPDHAPEDHGVFGVHAAYTSSKAILCFTW